MDTKIVFSGLGVLSAAGRNINEFYDNLSKARCFIKPLRKVNADKFKTRIGAEIDKIDTVEKNVMSSREFRKLADFCKYGVVSCDEAMRDAGFDIEQYDPYKIGTMVGNCYGGLEFSESELINLNKGGVKNVSSYLAVAWFPTALQGQISIKNKFLGYSKTYVCDRISSSWAAYDTALKLVSGVLDFSFCGGAEGVHSPFGNLCLSTRPETINSEERGDGLYAPFSLNGCGSAIGEGAAFFTMERKNDALRRGAKIYAELAACEINNDCSSDPMDIDGEYENFKKAVRRSLEKSQLSVEQIDCIIPSAVGMNSCDVKEYAVLREIFGKRLDEIAISIPKTMFGDTLGASSAFDILCGLLMLENNILFPSVNIGQLAAEVKLQIRKKSQPLEMKNMLVLNRGVGGNNSSIVLKKVSQ